MTSSAIQPATSNPTNNEFIARAMKHTQPKDMDDKQRDCHIAIRNFFREMLDADGVPSINKATPQQLKTNIEQTVTYVKNGSVYESKKLSIADQVVVACWALRFEANVIAKSEEITVLRSIEKYIINDFDFESNTGKKKKAAEPKSKGEKPVAAKKQPAEPAPAAIVGDWTERLDLLPQLEFHAAEPVSKVAELLEAWNAGGEFCLMVKRSTAMGKIVKSLDESHDRQTLILYDVNEKKIGMAYMDKLLQYFTIMEKTA